MSKEEKVKKNKKFKIIIICIICVICICFIFSIIFALINIGNKKIIRGVYINNIDVCKNSKESTIERFKELEENIKKKEIILKCQEIERPFTLEEIELEYKIENAVNEAYLIGRDSNIFKNNLQIVQALIYNKNIDIEYHYNEEKLQAIISEFNSKLPNAVQQYSYSVEDEELIISNGKIGMVIEKEKLIDKIKEAIITFSINADIVNVEVIEEKPEPIDIEKIHSEIYKETQDAYITEEPKTVHPNVNGVDFAISMEEAKEILKEEKEEYIIPLKITIAKITLADLGKEAFPNELGSFSTKFNISNTDRSTNLKLATNKVNGTIVMPGEIFSYNKVVGKRTVEAGFKEAGAYVGGEIVQEVGGGICQVSSTLYNAALYANLEIVERHNHYFESSYVAASRDATVSWGTLDFKFKNNRTYPIKIVATCKNGIVTTTIYGIPEETEYEVIIQSKVTSKIERNTKYEEDNTIELGKEVVTQTGHDGCTSEAYKILRLNGEKISTTLLSKDTYHALDMIIKKGTKKTVETSANVVNTESNEEKNTEEKSPNEIENEIIENTAENEIENNTIQNSIIDE